MKTNRYKVLLWLCLLFFAFSNTCAAQKLHTDILLTSVKYRALLAAHAPRTPTILASLALRKDFSRKGGPVPAHLRANEDSAADIELTGERLRWSDTINKKRLIGVSVGTLGAYSVIMTGVGFAWYGNQKLGKFRWFADEKEWLQIDKTGHWFAPYMITVYGYNMLRWSGMKNTPAALTAGAFGFLSLTAMEIPDGLTQKYGASWSDIVFNFGGAAFATTQYLIWKEQRIYTKYSFHLVDYPAGELRERANNLYGSSFIERVLKDYNGTTMWLSFNLYSFNHKIKPKWLNIAFGYAAGNLYGGFENKWTDKNGVYHDRSDLKRYRRFFISLDADYTKFKAKTRAGKMILGILNVVKLPMPAIEFNTLGQFVFHPMYFLNLDVPLTVNMKR